MNLRKFWKSERVEIRKNKNNNKGKKVIVLVINSWRPRLKGALRNILELFLNCNYLNPLEPKGEHPLYETEYKNGEHKY